MEYVLSRPAVPGTTYKFADLPVGAAFRLGTLLFRKINGDSRDIMGLSDGILGNCEPEIPVVYCVVRQRRGVWVEVPPEWVGKTVSNQKKNKRDSKMTPKEKRYSKRKLAKGYIVPGSRDAEEQEAIDEHEDD